MKFKLVSTVLTAFALLGPVGAFSVDTSTDTAGQYVDDATITTRVKASLAQEKGVKSRDISVRTDQGVVDLTGTVQNKEESDRATDIATKVKSVKAVHNNLKIN